MNNLNLYINFLKQIPIFSLLNEKELSSVASVIKEKKYRKQAVIFCKDDIGCTLFIIKKGRVKVSIESKDGREIILAILDEKDFFGEMSLLDGKPRSATVVALDNTTVLMINRTKFLTLLKTIPSISIKLLEELSNRLRKANIKIEQLAFLRRHERLIHTLLELATKYGVAVKDGILIDREMTRDELAGLINACRETTIRKLKELEKKEFIKLCGKKIIIRKPKLMLTEIL